MAYHLARILGAFTLFAAAMLQTAPAAAQTVHWANCGAEKGSDCAIPISEPVIMRYGLDGKYIYITATGRPTIRCHNSLGDGARGASKLCSYRRALPGEVPPTSGWRVCGQDDQWCRNVGGTPDRPVWFRYGLQGRYTYGLVSGQVYCDYDVTGDPVAGLGLDGKERCEIGPVYTGVSPRTTWIICANEGQKCNLPGDQGDSVKLVRYGAGSNYTYKFIETGGKRISKDCTERTFASDPAPGARKICAFARGPAVQIKSVTGEWQLVQSTTGRDSAISTQMEVGVEREQSTTNTSEWGLAVSQTTEVGAKALGGGVSTTITLSTGGSRALTDAVRRGTKTTRQVTCGTAGKGINKTLYQWRYEVLESCKTRGTCSSTVFTDMTVCATDLPIAPAEFRPVCQPGCCKNALCTVCFEQPAVCQQQVNPKFAGLQPVSTTATAATGPAGAASAPATPPRAPGATPPPAPGRAAQPLDIPALLRAAGVPASEMAAWTQWATGMKTSGFSDQVIRDTIAKEAATRFPKPQASPAPAPSQLPAPAPARAAAPAPAAAAPAPVAATAPPAAQPTDVASASAQQASPAEGGGATIESLMDQAGLTGADREQWTGWASGMRDQGFTDAEILEIVRLETGTPAGRQPKVPQPQAQMAAPAPALEDRGEPRPVPSDAAFDALFDEADLRGDDRRVWAEWAREMIDVGSSEAEVLAMVRQELGLSMDTPAGAAVPTATTRPDQSSGADPAELAMLFDQAGVSGEERQEWETWASAMRESGTSEAEVMAIVREELDLPARDEPAAAQPAEVTSVSALLDQAGLAGADRAQWEAWAGEMISLGSSEAEILAMVRQELGLSMDAPAGAADPTATTQPDQTSGNDPADLAMLLDQAGVSGEERQEWEAWASAMRESGTSEAEVMAIVREELGLPARDEPAAAQAADVAAVSALLDQAGLAGADREQWDAWAKELAGSGLSGAEIEQMVRSELGLSDPGATDAATAEGADLRDLLAGEGIDDPAWLEWAQGLRESGFSDSEIREAIRTAN